MMISDQERGSDLRDNRKEVIMEVMGVDGGFENEFVKEGREQST